MSHQTRKLTLALMVGTLIFAATIGTTFAHGHPGWPRHDSSPTPAVTAAPTAAPKTAAPTTAHAKATATPKTKAKTKTPAPTKKALKPTLKPTPTPAPTSGSGKPSWNPCGGGSTPTPTPTPTPGASGTPAPTEQPTSTPTVKPTPSPTPIPTPSPTPKPTPTPTPVPTPTPTPVPSPTLEPPPTPVIIGPGAAPMAQMAVSAGSSSAAGSSTSSDAALATDLTDSFYGRIVNEWLRHFDGASFKDVCNLTALRTGIKSSIDFRISTLQALESVTNHSGMPAADAKTVDDALDGALVDLRALERKVNEETTYAGLQNDQKTLATTDQLLITAGRWVKDVMAAETALKQSSGLQWFERWLARRVEAAPPNEAAAAQQLLDQMNAAIASGADSTQNALETLLTVHTPDLESGGATTTLAASETNLAAGVWQIQRAATLGAQLNHTLGPRHPGPTPR